MIEKKLLKKKFKRTIIYPNTISIFILANREYGANKGYYEYQKKLGKRNGRKILKGGDTNV